MSDGQLILVAARCSLRESAHPCLRRESGCPASCCSSASAWRSARTARAGSTSANYELARTIGVVALALILFEGGLTAGFDEIRPVLRPSLSAWRSSARSSPPSICGLAAAWLFDLSTLEGMLLGAIISSTDGAAIFALLRESTLRRRLARTLEGEAGFNDPVAVLLVIGFIDWIQHPDYGVLDMLGLFVREIGIGAAVGLAVGWLARVGAPPLAARQPGLYPVATLAGRRRSRSAAPPRCTAPGSSPSTWRG